MSQFQISFVLGSESPGELASFYGFAMGGNIHRGSQADHWYVSHPNGINLEIFRPSNKRFWQNRGKAFALCIRCSGSTFPLKTIYEWINALKEKGAVVIENARLEAFGAECWLKDPQGNEFIIVVPHSIY